MHFIDIHDVGYGECIVFEGEKNEILMVDCGSMNTILKNSHIKFKDYVSDFIMPRYDDALEKKFSSDALSQRPLLRVEVHFEKTKKIF